MVKKSGGSASQFSVANLVPDGDGCHFPATYSQRRRISLQSVADELQSPAYNRKNGVLGRVVPCNNFGRDGIGAWEIAARWSMLDLNSNDIRGGRMNTTTLGTNWYLNKYTKFQFNYIHAFLNSPANGDNEADVFAMRAQIDF